ncbi:MAG: bifunctional hydroxymethylpyrimidine kinase/phosphomethylpyrimidine kinase [Alphaproteobacteria bacterium]|nr:bifunctional hydroxymethylpyrimidine kinase/phosphomethylpyrimidine kinase [Alphaproteobacteria bacterium]
MSVETAGLSGKAPQGRPVALTIAGSDSSGGAGIQADLKTFTAHGVYGASVITALTAQNTQGVDGVLAIPAAFVGQQLRSVVEDLGVRAAKTGMLANREVIENLSGSGSMQRVGLLVVDPVMIATSGDQLLERSAVSALCKGLFPLAKLVTPNIAEAAVLSGRPEARSEAELEAQGREILNFGCEAVLMKGGHMLEAGPQDAVDLLVTSDSVRRFVSPRVETRHTHGSGCTLSAAIVANLAGGDDLEIAVEKAKGYVFRAIKSAAKAPVGSGASPLDHMVNLQIRDRV